MVCCDTIVSGKSLCRRQTRVKMLSGIAINVSGNRHSNGGFFSPKFIKILTWQTLTTSFFKYQKFLVQIDFRAYMGLYGPFSAFWLVEDGF